MSTKTYFSIGRKGKLAMAILATLSAASSSLPWPGQYVIHGAHYRRHQTDR